MISGSDRGEDASEDELLSDLHEPRAAGGCEGMRDPWRHPVSEAVNVN